MEFRIKMDNLNVKQSLMKIPKRMFKRDVNVEICFDSAADYQKNIQLVNKITDTLILDGWIINYGHIKGVCIRFKKDAEFNGNSIIVKVVEL